MTLADEIALAAVAQKYHEDGIRMRLHDVGPMAGCAAVPCRKWMGMAALRAGGARS